MGGEGVNTRSNDLHMRVHTHTHTPVCTHPSHLLMGKKPAWGLQTVTDH